MHCIWKDANNQDCGKPVDFWMGKYGLCAYHWSLQRGAVRKAATFMLYGMRTA